MSVASCEAWRLLNAKGFQCSSEIICVLSINFWKKTLAFPSISRNLWKPSCWFQARGRLTWSWGCLGVFKSKPALELRNRMNRETSWKPSNKNYSEYVKWYSSASWYFSLSLCERDVKDGCRGVMVVSAMQWMKAHKFIEPLKGQPTCLRNASYLGRHLNLNNMTEDFPRSWAKRGDLMNYGKHDLCLAIQLCHILLYYTLYFSMSDQNLRCLRSVEFQERSLRGSKHSHKLTEGASTAWKFWWSLLKAWDPAMQV